MLLAVLNWAERARRSRCVSARAKPAPRACHSARGITAATSHDRDNVRRHSHESRGAVIRSGVVCLSVAVHRAASVRQLRWSDVDLERKTIHWRPEVDKIQYDHTNPAQAELLPLLERAKAIADLTGDTYLFPSRRRPSEAMSRNAASLSYGE